MIFFHGEVSLSVPLRWGKFRAQSMGQRVYYKMHRAYLFRSYPPTDGFVLCRTELLLYRYDSFYQYFIPTGNVIKLSTAIIQSKLIYPAFFHLSRKGNQDSLNLITLSGTEIVSGSKLILIR